MDFWKHKGEVWLVLCPPRRGHGQKYIYVETIQMSIKQWVDKQNVVYIHVENIIFGQIKKWIDVTYDNTNEPWNPHARWRKAAIKDLRLHNPVDMKYPEHRNL